MLDFKIVECFGKVPVAIPQKKEWDILARIFESPVDTAYYYSLLSELYEIIAGKRLEFQKDPFLIPEEHTVPKGDPSSYIILKVQGSIIHLEDLKRDEIMDLNLVTFTQYVDDWIKFVEKIERV